MAIVMQATDDPGASPANTIAFGSFAAVAILVAWMVYRPLVHIHSVRAVRRHR
jgi:hypothetical protein